MQIIKSTKQNNNLNYALNLYTRKTNILCPIQKVSLRFGKVIFCNFAAFQPLILVILRTFPFLTIYNFGNILGHH